MTGDDRLMNLPYHAKFFRYLNVCILGTAYTFDVTLGKAGKSYTETPKHSSGVVAYNGAN